MTGFLPSTSPVIALVTPDTQETVVEVGTYHIDPNDPFSRFFCSERVLNDVILPSSQRALLNQNLAIDNGREPRRSKRM